MKTGKAAVYNNKLLAGYLSKESDKYYFKYAEEYLSNQENPPISLSLPKREEEYESDFLFPFFYGLLAEGDNKELQCRALHIDPNDHFTRLVKTAGKDTIGGITVEEEK